MPPPHDVTATAKANPASAAARYFTPRGYELSDPAPSFDQDEAQPEKTGRRLYVSRRTSRNAATARIAAAYAQSTAKPTHGDRLLESGVSAMIARPALLGR